MFCHDCGVALAAHLKYCNRCGAQLVTSKDAVEAQEIEERLREELVELFWATVIGLGIIVGGMAVIKTGLHLSEGILIGYMILSSTAFAINIALGLWQIRRLARSAEEAKQTLLAPPRNTNELIPPLTRGPLEAVPSVTEHTTRTLER